MTITAPPSTIPNRKMTQDQFDIATSDWIAWQQASVAEFNAAVAEVNANKIAAYDSAVAAVNSPSSGATSTTSMTIGLGSKTFTIQTAKTFYVGQFVIIAITASPTNLMHGNITAYDSGSGSMTVNVTRIDGSGSATAWTVAISGPQAAVGAQTISIPASGMRGRITNGARFRIAETTTNKNMESALWFSNSVTEYAQFSVVMPKSWDRGTISFQPWWIADSGSGGVVWAVQAVAVGDGDARDVAYGTAQVSIDTFVSAAQPHTGPLPGTPVTAAGSPSVGDKLMIQVYRDQAHASDTLAVEAGLTDIVIFYSTNAPNDS